MDFPGGAKPRLHGPFYPAVFQGRVLAREVDWPFWSDNMGVQTSLLARLEHGKGPTCELVFAPDLANSRFKLFCHLWVDLRHVLQRLDDALVRWERPPASGVFSVRIAAHQHAAPCGSTVVQVVNQPVRQIGDYAPGANKS